MTDVQVSNARMISFTALALVTFGVCAWLAHLLGANVLSAVSWKAQYAMGLSVLPAACLSFVLRSSACKVWHFEGLLVALLFS